MNMYIMEHASATEKGERTPLSVTRTRWVMIILREGSHREKASGL